MVPFDVLISKVPDPDLGPLLTKLNADGFDPIVTPAGGESAGVARRPERADRTDLPTEWHLVREMPDQSYAWPEVRDRYLRYRVFAADIPRHGITHIALGETVRANAWGRDRTYLIAFLTSGTPQVPLVEFLEVDDHDSTHELLAIVRGSDGGKKMYGPGDSLPDVYAQHFRTEVYSKRVVYPRSWNKLAVIAHKDDHTTILNHALLQARRRGDL